MIATSTLIFFTLSLLMVDTFLQQGTGFRRPEPRHSDQKRRAPLRGLALVDFFCLGYVHAPRNGGTAPDGSHPSPKIRKVFDVYPRPVMERNPGVRSHIRNGVKIPGYEFILPEARVEHRVEPFRLALVTAYGVFDLFRRVPEENVGLSLHRPYAGHLEHEPLYHCRAPLDVPGQELARLFREVYQYSARLEHGEIVVIVVDYGGYSAVRVYLQIPVLPLLELPQMEVD